MIEQAIAILKDRRDLTGAQARAVCDEIMSGTAGEARTAAYLALLSAKGETVEEIAGSAASMRAHATVLPTDIPVLEIVGTGGDGSDSFNISTTSAFVLTALGVKVAKHGNRAATSKCGAADVLEALGADINLSPERSAEILDKVGFCFMFAQKYHPAMKYVAPVRKALPIRTVFNLIGPLSNPANVSVQLMGVASRELVEPMAGVLSALGVTKGAVFFGTLGLDEVSPCGESVVSTLGAERKLFSLFPEDMGLERGRAEELKGGLPAENAALTRAVLSGEKGTRRTAVLMNAALAYSIYAGISLQDAAKAAAGVIDDGSALKKLEEYVRESRA